MTSLASPFVFLAGVVMGTGSTITVKILYGLTSIGLTGQVQLFEKPLFLTLVMFVAMTIALPVHFVVEGLNRRRRRLERKQQLEQQLQQEQQQQQQTRASQHRHQQQQRGNGRRAHQEDDELDDELFLNGVVGAHRAGNGQLNSYQRSSSGETLTLKQEQLKSSASVSESAFESALDLEDIEVPWRTYFLLAIPSAFDLFGTALASIGLLFTTVSVYQLARCSVIIVCALLKATVLKERLSRSQWFGIFVNTVAMVLVSSTSWVPSQNSGASSELELGIDRDPRLGIAFIMASCVVQGSQYVFEERVMTVDNAPPLVVVGMEGVWGTLMMFMVVFPWAYLLPGSDVGGCMENIHDSLLMVNNSASIQYVLLAFTLTVCAYNIFCIYVTFLLSSIWHAILDNFRPIAVWMTDLALYYIITEQQFGEQWTSASWLELVGMILLFVGTAIYNGTLQIPCLFAYDDMGEVEMFEEGEDEQLASRKHDNGIPSRYHDADTPLLQKSTAPSHSAHTPSLDISSPLLTRSPLITRQIRSPHSSSSSLSTSRDLSETFGVPQLGVSHLSHSYTPSSTMSALSVSPQISAASSRLRGAVTSH